MKWVRLLAVGKSLVGLKDGDSRYRVSAKGGLPRFDSAKNPFRATTLPSGRPAEPSPESEAAPVPAPAPASPPSAPEVVPAGRWQRLTARLWRTRPATPFGKGNALLALQTELRLDRVKVVRNDLSESDIEVVQMKRAAKSAPADRAESQPCGSETGVSEADVSAKRPCHEVGT